MKCNRTFQICMLSVLELSLRIETRTSLPQSLAEGRVKLHPSLLILISKVHFALGGFSILCPLCLCLLFFLLPGHFLELYLHLLMRK